jgi:cardiolipin synthase
MAITPFFVLAVNDRDFQLALWILIVGGITDAVDGWLARSLHSRSVVGEFLDPIADKLLLTVAYVSLTIPQGQQVVIPLWLAILALFRDFLIVLVAVILYAVGRDTASRPRFWATRLHAVTVVVLLASLVRSELATKVLHQPLVICRFATSIGRAAVGGAAGYLQRRGRSASPPIDLLGRLPLTFADQEGGEARAAEDFGRLGRHDAAEHAPRRGDRLLPRWSGRPGLTATLGRDPLAPLELRVAAWSLRPMNSSPAVLPRRGVLPIRRS